MIQLGVWQRTAHLTYGGPRRYLQTFIHPDIEHFRAAANRYSGSDFAEASGCCQPAPVRAEPYRHWAGVVRLVAGHVTTEIVAHEFTHAALVIYRMDVKADVRLGNGCRGPRRDARVHRRRSHRLSIGQAARIGPMVLTGQSARLVSP